MAGGSTTGNPYQGAAPSQAALADLATARQPGEPLTPEEMAEWESLNAKPNTGTSWERSSEEQLELVGGPGTDGSPDKHYDQRAFQYGRDPLAAQAAVDKAHGVGDTAFGVGAGLLASSNALADDARNRTAPTGNFDTQNRALGSSMTFADKMSSVENEQGPSGAQAQLQQGTNMAMAQQMAMARSGRGMGGNAAAMGLAQGNMAGISANQANQAANLRAQENAAWRGRQATNYGNAAAIAQGAGTQYGAQANTNLNAYLQNQSQNDAASLGYRGQGATAFGQGVAGSFAGQGLANGVRGMEMSGGQAEQDMLLRGWAARNGFNIQNNAASAQQTAAMIQGAATVGGGLIGAFAGGPAGAAAGAGLGGAAGKAVTG